jgi:hypothetical protein
MVDKLVENFIKTNKLENAPELDFSDYQSEMSEDSDLSSEDEDEEVVPI